MGLFIGSGRSVELDVFLEYSIVDSEIAGDHIGDDIVSFASEPELVAFLCPIAPGANRSQISLMLTGCFFQFSLYAASRALLL